MRKYECLYIIASNVEDTPRAELIQKFQKMAGAGATVEKWGLKKFATPINYRAEGFYVLMNFSGDEKLVGKMSALMNITDGLVRFMFVTKDDKQIAQDAVRKQQRREAREAREGKLATAANTGTEN
jgi:small subunit ribosomal protein S6